MSLALEAVAVPDEDSAELEACRVRMQKVERPSSIRMTAFSVYEAGWLDYASWFRIFGIEFSDLNPFCESDFAEEPDAVVVDVELVPFEAVAGADGMGVVVVVPAFAEGEQGDPEAVAGGVGSGEAT